MSNITYDSARISNISVSQLDYQEKGSTSAFTRTVKAVVSSSRVIWTLDVQNNTTYNIQFQAAVRIPNGEGAAVMYAFASTDINGVSERNGAVIYKVGDASDNIGFVTGVNGPNTFAILSTSSTPIGTLVNAKIDVVKVSSVPRTVG